MMTGMASIIHKRYLAIGISLLVFLGLYFTSLYSYLLFHSLAEIFSIIVAVCIFMIAWNARQLIKSNYLLFLGNAYLFVGFLDLLHTLSYKGMGVFTGYNANLPTQLWILARYMESISLFIAPLFFARKIEAVKLFIGYLIATALLLSTIFFWKIFPDCFIEQTGLTSFKRLSEYIISTILLCSIGLMYKKRQEFDTDIFKLIVASIIITIGSELAFTFYISVYGLSNLMGHFFKIASFYLIYRALIETGLKKPYSLLFRNLKKSEEALLLERDRLEKALSQIKTLKGLLPICANCKKIRDDKGYWNQIESYVQAHSDAEFSHGICPECMKKLYPDFVKDKDQ